MLEHFLEHGLLHVHTDFGVFVICKPLFWVQRPKGSSGCFPQESSTWRKQPRKDMLDLNSFREARNWSQLGHLKDGWPTDSEKVCRSCLALELQG